MKLQNHSLMLRGKSFVPIFIGGMGVNISTAELALVACEIGAIGHISDAMIQYVSDKIYGTKYSKEKQRKHRLSLLCEDKTEVKFNLEHVYESQKLHVESTMNRKKGGGLIFLNIMERLTMGAPSDTLRARLTAALDAGIDGVTLSAGLHLGSLGLIKDHPRFHDVLIGIIVSSVRALRAFLKSASRQSRLPDYIIVEGPLAGGHLGFGEDWEKYDLNTIVKEVSTFLNQEGLIIPIIAAGGIFSGEDALRTISSGASGVQIATRLTVTKESGLPEHVKQEYFKAKKSDLVVNNLSPSGYLMRMLKNSPCLDSNVRPACEAFGYMLSRDGKCAYIDSFKAANPDWKSRNKVNDKMCICHHFSRCTCYTCGENVYRLKEKAKQSFNGAYELPTAREVIFDYLS